MLGTAAVMRLQIRDRLTGARPRILRVFSCPVFALNPRSMQRVLDCRRLDAYSTAMSESSHEFTTISERVFSD
jgi:hypothetical protein